MTTNYQRVQTEIKIPQKMLQKDNVGAFKTIGYQ